MDPAKNHIPATVTHIHLIAACGTGMGALACMLKDLGYRVTGSDQHVYPPMSHFLEQKGIRVKEGFRTEHLSEKPDLVVIGNAVTRQNSEAEEAKRLGLPYCSMPQALNHFVAADKRIILVTGTHGKTTTASLAAWMLQACGMDPSFFVGGILQNFNSNYRLGQGPFMVIEGDEYDTAFFDKGPKFRHYPPFWAVLTGVEFDHADIFTDLARIESIFDPFLESLSPETTLAVFDGNDSGVKLSRNRHCNVLYYGDAPASHWQLGEVAIHPPWTQFEVIHQQVLYGTFKTRMIGRHNLHNVLAVIAMAHDLGISRDKIAAAIEQFINTRRRQEVRGIRNGVTVIDDFAHHPTAVRETVKAVNEFYRGQRLIAVFEPRTNTSMRDVFQTAYPEALALADLICVREPALLKKIPLGQRFSSAQLVNDLSAMGKSAHYFPDTVAILEFLRNEARSGDVVLIMSNGGFDDIHQRLLASI